MLSRGRGMKAGIGVGMGKESENRRQKAVVYGPLSSLEGVR